MKYLKKFSNHSDYNTFTGSTEFIKPNVSHCIQENDVHYNPREDEPTPKWIATYSDSHTESAECDDTGIIVENEITKENLVSVEIGNCLVSLGTAAFANSASLVRIDIPDSLEWIDEYVFFNCTSLTNIDIPSGVTSISAGAFRGCTSLTNIDIPSGVTSIGNLAFYDCTSLQGITVNAINPPSLVDSAFQNTNNAPIYVPNVDTYKSAEGWSRYADRIFPIE